MLCVCADSLAKALSNLAPIGPNANLAGSLAAGLNANSALVAAANAAGAAQATGAMAGNLAAGMSAGANLGAMASLSAVATFCANMKAGFGIDMSSSAAPAELSDLLQSLANNALNKVLSQLPLDALPKLKGLGDVALAMPAAASLGINLLLPDASAKLNAAAAAAAAANANAAAAAGMSAAAAASMAAQMGAAASANAALKATFGVGLGMGAGGLGESLNRVFANMAALPNLGAAIAAELLQKVADLLKAVGAINRGLGIDLTVPGAGKNLDQAISEARSVNHSVSENRSVDRSQSHTQQQNLSEALAIARSQDFNRVFGSGGIPGVPKLANLLAMFFNGLLTETGVRAAERSPCGPQCLFLPMLPPQCLCPKVKMALPQVPPTGVPLPIGVQAAATGSVAVPGLAAALPATPIGRANRDVPPSPPREVKFDDGRPATGYLPMGDGAPDNVDSAGKTDAAGQAGMAKPAGSSPRAGLPDDPNAPAKPKAPTPPKNPT